MKSKVESSRDDEEQRRQKKHVIWHNGCQEKNGKEILESRNERELKGKEPDKQEKHPSKMKSDKKGVNT